MIGIGIPCDAFVLELCFWIESGNEFVFFFFGYCVEVFFVGERIESVNGRHACCLFL